MTKRNIIPTIFLMLFTCGIYYLYMIYTLTSEVNRLTNQYKNKPAMDLLLSIVTCGLYQIYWFYKIGKQLEDTENELGMHNSSISILCPILAVFGFGIVSMCILISEENNIIDEKEII